LKSPIAALQGCLAKAEICIRPRLRADPFSIQYRVSLMKVVSELPGEKIRKLAELVRVIQIESWTIYFVWLR
jgi:hypothetical protein